MEHTSLDLQAYMFRTIGVVDLTTSSTLYIQLEDDCSLNIRFVEVDSLHCLQEGDV